MFVRFATVTLDRTDATGREFTSEIHIGPDGWSQSGEELGATRDIAAAIFDALQKCDAFEAEGEPE